MTLSAIIANAIINIQSRPKIMSLLMRTRYRFCNADLRVINFDS